MSGDAPPLDSARLAALLRGGPFADRLVVLGTPGSTNDELRRLADGGAPELTVVLAEGQRAGRGRLGRAWHSPPGLGAYVSVLFRPARPPAEATRWTIAAGLAAAAACRRLSPVPVVVEWPNDLVCRGRKLGGVLAEMRTAGGSLRDLIVGTGVNLAQRPEDFPPDLRGLAGSLAELSGRPAPSREEWAAAYLDELLPLHRSLVRGEWRGVAEAWTALAPGAHGAEVLVEPGAGSGGPAPFRGRTRGLDEAGALVVERRDGSRVPVRLVDSIRMRGGR